MLHSFRNLFASSQNRKSRRASASPKLELLRFEDRITPTAFPVTNTGDSGAGSLREAITLANASDTSPDTIIFTTGGTGTITLQSALPTIASASTAGALTILGRGASSTIISGDNNDLNRNFNIFNINIGGNLTLSGMTISGAKFSGSGGGISNSGTLAISNSTLSGNTATNYGGGIFNNSKATLTVSNSTLSGNTANTNSGGGIYNGGTLIVSNSTLSGNTASSYSGGGIFNHRGTLTVSNSTLSSNAAGFSGGGIGIRNGGTVTVSNSTLSGNTASSNRGGGIYNGSGTLTVSNSTLSGNIANRGGAIFNFGATLTLSNSTLSGNTANSGGGGINNDGTLNIANTIIANSTRGGDYTGNGTVNLIGSSTAFNNLVSLGSFPWATTSGAINLGPLQNNGGPTFTMALGAGSPAIGAGNAGVSNASPINGLDQRGITRSPTAPSIGAYEAPAPSPSPSPTPTPTPTVPLLTGTPPPRSSGGSSTVTLYDPVTGQPTGTAVPFPGFSGPVHVVSGDWNNDGIAEIVAGAGDGGGPVIAILDSQTGAIMKSFFAFDPAFRGGVFVAVRDVNNDGVLDIIAGAGRNGGPEVRIFDGRTLNVLKAFYAYDPTFTGGVSVASVDFNGDGILDLVTGAGPGGAPHVKVFDGATNAIISQWYAYPVSFTGGVFVAAGDIGNDGTFEVVTGAGAGGAPIVAVWNPFTGALITQFMAYAEGFTGGVRVAVNDGNGDGIADIITGAGPDGGPEVKVFSFPALDLLFSFYSGDPTNTGGVFVG